jgi:hypothetical protein
MVVPKIDEVSLAHKKLDKTMRTGLPLKKDKEASASR